MSLFSIYAEICEKTFGHIVPHDFPLVRQEKWNVRGAFGTYPAVAVTGSSLMLFSIPLSNRPQAGETCTR